MQAYFDSANLSEVLDEVSNPSVAYPAEAYEIDARDSRVQRVATQAYDRAVQAHEAWIEQSQLLWNIYSAFDDGPEKQLSLLHHQTFGLLPESQSPWKPDPYLASTRSDANNIKRYERYCFIMKPKADLVLAKLCECMADSILADLEDMLSDLGSVSDIPLPTHNPNWSQH